MFFASKQKQVQQQIAAYCGEVVSCVDLMEQAFKRYCDHEDRDRLAVDVKEIHATESRADDLRQQVEVLMYSKSLFPESRGDILGLLESLDGVPNQAEAIIRLLWTHHISIPDGYQQGMIQLIAVCRRCVHALLDSVEKLFVDFTNATVAIGKVDELESAADDIEGDMVERIYASDLPDLQKILIERLVHRIACVSDRAENTGDRIRIIVAKRSV